MLTFLIAFAIMANASAPTRKINLRELSRGMAVKGSPDHPIEAEWATSAKSYTDGVTAYRYVHAMVNAAIFGKERKIRKIAQRWLWNYQCENWLACQSYLDYFNAALEKNKLKREDSETKSYNGLRIKIGERVKMFASQAPEKSGVCAPAARRVAWLEQEYRLLCPTKPGRNHLCPKCLDTNWLKKRIDQDSGQWLMSSAFLEGLEHDGAADCSKPWKTILTCNGAMQTKFTLHCEKEAGGEVRCKE